MNKFKKLFVTLAVAATGLSSLTSCTPKLVKSWTQYSSQVRKDGNIEFITIDDVVELKDKKDFIVFLGPADNTSTISLVSSMQMLADYREYDNYIYVVDIQEELEKASTMVEAKNKLGVKEIQDAQGSPLTAVCYKNGSVYFDTSKFDPNDNQIDPLDRFYIDAGSGSKALNFLAIAQYAFENYNLD